MASSPSNVLTEQVQKVNQLLELMDRRTVEVEQRSVSLQDDVETEYQRRFHNLASARESAFSFIETLRTQRGSALREQTEQLEQLVAVLEEAADTTPASADAQSQAVLEQLVADLAFQLGQVSAEIDDVLVEFPAVQEVLDNDQHQYDDAMGDESDALAGNVDRLLTLARTVLEHVSSQSQHSSKPSATVLRSGLVSKEQYIPYTERSMSSKTTFSFPQSSTSTSYWLQKTKAVLSTREEGGSLKIKLPLHSLPAGNWLLGSSDGTSRTSSMSFTNPLDKLPGSQWLSPARQESSGGKQVSFMHELSKLPASTWLSSNQSGDETDSFPYSLASLPASQWLHSGDTTTKQSDPQYSSSVQRCVWLMNDMKLDPSKASSSLNTFNYPLASAGITHWLHSRAEQHDTKQFEMSPFHHIATAHSEKSLPCQWLVANCRSHDRGEDGCNPGFSFEHILSSPTGKWLLRSMSGDQSERALGLCNMGMADMGQWLRSPSSAAHAETEKKLSWMEHIAATHSSQWLRGHSTTDGPPAKIPRHNTGLTQWLLSSQNASESLSSVFEQVSLSGTKQGQSSSSSYASDDSSGWFMSSLPAVESTAYKTSPITPTSIASLGSDRGYSIQQMDLTDKPEFYSWLARSRTPRSETTNSEFEVLSQDAMMDDT